MKSRCFVIPDIHGCVRTFFNMIENVIRIKKTDSLYLLGDIIDRGPASKEVLDEIRRLQMEGYDINSVLGNHEEMFLQSCHDRTYFRMWTLNGGQSTLKSFGVEDSCEIPLLYRRFIESFPYYIKLDDFILVHAGLNFKLPDPLADREAMLWSREREVIKDLIGGRRVIGGHTPLGLAEINRSLSTDRIMLDNGCVYKGEPGLGNLLALELNSMVLYSQKNIDM
jgi:serine/threonine protein phosphatase 1